MNNATNQAVQDSSQNTLVQGVIDVLSSPVADFVLKLALAAAVVVGGWFVILFIVSKIKAKIMGDSLDETDQYQQKVADLVWSIVFTTLMVFNVLIGFEILGFSVGVLMAGISFGIGFAMQQILGNMMAGIMLITNKKFKIGDIVQILAPLNLFGTIMEIHIRYTIIKTFDNRRVIVPNLNLISTPIKTFKSEEIIRNELPIAVMFDANIDLAKKVIIETINAHPAVIIKENTSAVVTEFYHSGITITAYFYNNPKKKSWFVIKSDLRKVILNKLSEVGINGPYTHMVLTVDKNDQNLLGSLSTVAKNIKIPSAQ